MEGWRVASKRLGALPRIKRGALGRGCGRERSAPRAGDCNLNPLGDTARASTRRASSRAP